MMNSGLAFEALWHFTCGWTHLSIPKKNILVSIGVSAAESLEPLPGTITAACEMVKWGEAAGFESYLLTDREGNQLLKEDGKTPTKTIPLTLARIKAVLNPVFQDNAGILDHVIIHLAGHGFRKGTLPTFLLTNWASTSGDALDTSTINRHLQYFHINSLTLIYDACAGWNNDVGNGIDLSDLDTSKICDLGAFLRQRDETSSYSRFNASATGRAAYMMRGSESELPISLFSCALLRAMSGVDTSEPEVQFHALDSFVRKEFKKIAVTYGLDQEAVVESRHRDEHLYTKLPIDYAPLPLPRANDVTAQFVSDTAYPFIRIPVLAPAKNITKVGPRSTVEKSKMVGKRLAKTHSKKAVAAKPSLRLETVRLPSREAMGRDDLKRISGIGPQLEAQLNQLGLSQISQIANLTRNQIAAMDTQLKFKGRIERDAWVDQARGLLTQKEQRPPSRGDILQELISGWHREPHAQKNLVLIDAHLLICGRNLNKSNIRITEKHATVVQSELHDRPLGETVGQYVALEMPDGTTLPICRQQKKSVVLWVDDHLGREGAQNGALALHFPPVESIQTYRPPDSARAYFTHMNDNTLNEETIRDHSIGLRSDKHVDPMNGILSAYLSFSIGDIDTVRRIAWFYACAGEPIPFDIALLGDLPGKRVDGKYRVNIPAVDKAQAKSEQEKIYFEYQCSTEFIEDCEVSGKIPYLRDGWNFLEFGQLPIPEVFVALRRHVLKGYVVTSLDSKGGKKLRNLIKKRVI